MCSRSFYIEVHSALHTRSQKNCRNLNFNAINSSSYCSCSCFYYIQSTTTTAAAAEEVIYFPQREKCGFFLLLSLSRNLELNGRSFFELRENENLINYFRVDIVPEKQKDINKTCSVDLADHFGAPYVLSPRRTAPGEAQEDPYEARERVNN